MNAIEDNDFTRALARWGGELPRPKAILVVSAHWLTRGTYVTDLERPRTIHDFYGFPQQLSEIVYPAPGDHGWPGRVVEAGAGAARPDRAWGLDHASWTVLRHMYPKADVPVLELSLDYQWGEWNPRPMRYHYELAKRLLPLRRQGMMVIGSGNLVHNLEMIDWRNKSEAFPWAVEIDEAMRDRLLKGEHQALLDPRTLSEEFELAMPTLDHYLPMLYAIGLQQPGERVEFIHEGIQYGSISMRSFAIR